MTGAGGRHSRNSQMITIPQVNMTASSAQQQRQNNNLVVNDAPSSDGHQNFEELDLVVQQPLTV